MSKKKSLGVVMRDARLSMKLSMRALAEKIDKSPGFISDIENGNRRPSATTLKTLARSLRLTFTDVNQLRMQELSRATIEKATKELRTIKSGLSRGQRRRK